MTQAATMTEQERCPFCGHSASISDGSNGLHFRMICNNGTCRAAGPLERCAIDAASAWRARAALQGSAALPSEDDRDCPLCNGDCAGANPPVLDCPMKRLSPTPDTGLIEALELRNAAREAEIEACLARIAELEAALANAAPAQVESGGECPTCQGRGEMWAFIKGMGRAPDPVPCDACEGTGRASRPNQATKEDGL